ncbi:restriction endonuclease subunit S [Neisseria sp. P0012.S006]|uniref:restriction endonuclease subunit S n=1 Tax=Neisseria sp. P0012.S006 TaxID=3436732 RepID=UPI0036003BC3
MNKQQEPRLRFKGFTEEWKNKTLGDLGRVEMCRRIFKEQTQPSGEIPFFKIGTFGQEPDAFISSELFEEYRQKYPYPKQGDILISAAGTIGRTVKFTGENAYFQDSNIVWLRFDESQITSTFLNITYQNIKWDLEGSTIKRLYNSDLLSAEITVPSLPEQTHLGLFFSRLDSQIAESRAVLEKSRQLKKAMLAKMFPANGEKIPKIRFKGFEGEWECRKLGIEVEIIGGGTPDTTNSAYWNGDIDWYSPTEIGEAAYANGSVKKITLLGLQKSSAQILPANRTVLFTSRASIGDMAILTKDGSTNQGFQSFVVGERLDVYFFYTMGFKIKDYALKNASGSTFLEISKNTLSQMEFFAPSLKEQTAIGNFFRQLDETIALQTAEVEKLNQLKKGLLAAMLV